MDGLHYKI